MSKSNKMGVVQLTILTMVNMMGSGIIMLPTKLAEVGTISIISWLVTAVGSMALAWAFAKCGMFSRKSGGMGGYAEYAFGKSGNFMANYTYGVSLLIANVAIAISAVGYGTELFGATLTPVQIGLATIGVRRECDGRAVYSVHVYRHFLDALLHGAGAIHGYKISILYTI